MKRMLRKALAVLLSVIMAGSVCMFGVSAEGTAPDSDSTYYKGAFYYRPGIGEVNPGEEYVDVYTYTDDYFKKSGRDFDEHLATLSFALATASVGSTREPITEEGYRNKSRNAVAFLEDTGFSEIACNHDYTVKPTKDTMGVACAQKQIIENGKPYTLLVILPRSAGYEAEWGNNFVLGSDGNAAGFDAGAEKCLSFAKDYIAQKAISGDIKVWTTGFSRGAAIADLIAAKLIDDPQGYLGDTVALTSDNLYAYTCGTPSAADVDNDPRNEKYDGIFNGYLETDLAAAMAPVDMGFARCGTDRVLYQAENYDKMLANLAISNESVCSEYTASVNPKYFHPKRLGLVNGSISLVDDNNSYIPNDAKVYLRGLCTYLTQITGGREEYARTYEQPLSDLIAYYESLSGDESAAMTASITGNEKSLYLAVALYTYFILKKDDGKKDFTAEQIRQIVTQLAGIVASRNDSGNTGINAAAFAKASVLLATFLLLDADTVKGYAAGFLSDVLKGAMTASGATQEELDSVTDTESCLALTHFLSHLIFGNIWQSDEHRALNPNNEQIRAAATLIGNFMNLVVDHTNEIIISWLKTEDHYYDDYTALTPAQLAGYRRVYVSASDNTAFNGSITDADGKDIAVVENGVVKNSADKWIGFTQTDNGGFFRIPADQDISIRLNTVRSAAVSVGIGEYELYDAKTTMLFDQSVNARATDTVIISLPAVSQNEMPSDTAYSVTVIPGGEGSNILGDADMNGTVDMIDATWIQRHSAGLITLSDDALALCDVDKDESVTIMDVTAIQRYISMLKAPEGIGEPIA
ncbi:dockerin type I repeat-containing protein [Ruminococcus sp.]|uniref:dockerin type I repeat-containing protein n=1 Tax=Ruminococcus sp. TaxID=41978 RepID=UPI00386563EF